MDQRAGLITGPAGVPDLVVLVPTRERAAKAAEALQAFRETREDDSHLCLVVDWEDPTRSSYWDVVDEHDDDASICLVRGGNMVAALNEAANLWASGEASDKTGVEYAPRSLMFMGDDHRPRTAGWDSNYLMELRTLGTGFVYGNDLLQGHHLPTQIAMTTNIVRRLGWMAPPILKHMYVDNSWRDLGVATRRIIYRSDVVVEHMHPIAQKSEWDERYKIVNSGQVYHDDQVSYQAWKDATIDGSFRDCVQKINQLGEAR